MLSLIRKDLGVVAAFCALALPIYLVGVVSAARAGGVMFWVNVAFGVTLMLSVCLLDTRNGAGRFTHSLPVTRAGVVRARYGTAIVLAGFALGVGVLVGAVVRLAPADASWPRWVAPDVGLAYGLVMALIIAIYLPCYFRWGLGAGTVVAALALVGLIIAGDVAGGPARAGAAGTAGGAAVPRGLVVWAIVSLVERWGGAAASLAAAAAAAAVLTVSVALAERGYATREF
jgi:hypothetical protein